MKKQLVMITAAAITAAVCCPVLHASAEEAPFADAEALYESWENASEPGEDEYYSASGYPDYVCGVWTVHTPSRESLPHKKPSSPTFTSVSVTLMHGQAPPCSDAASIHCSANALSTNGLAPS